MTVRSGIFKSDAGTPVPRASKEVTGSGPVVVSRWTPEQIAEWEKLNARKTKSKVDVPVIPGHDWQKRKGTVEMKLTREIYLERRVAGAKQAEICKEFGLNFKGLFGHLEQWGLKDRGEEKAEVDRLRAQLGPTKSKSEPTPEVVQNKPRRGRPPKHAAPADTAIQPAVPKTEPPKAEPTQLYAKSISNLRKEVTVKVTLEEQIIRASFGSIVEDVHQTAVDRGWYEKPVPLPLQLALIHSEVSEALEADRREQGNDKLAEELADVIIRTMDAAAANKLDLTGALFAKLEKNRSREYCHGGLKY